MEEAQIAYLAGFLDGEGCVKIIRSQKGKYLHHELFVTITNTKQAPLLLAKNLFGGSIRNKGINGPRGTMPIFVWTVSARKALPFLSEIHRYCMVKGEEIKIAIEFQNHLILYNRKCGRGGLPPEILSYREDPYRKLKRSKHALSLR